MNTRVGTENFLPLFCMLIVEVSEELCSDQWTKFFSSSLFSGRCWASGFVFNIYSAWCWRFLQAVMLFSVGDSAWGVRHVWELIASTGSCGSCGERGLFSGCAKVGSLLSRVPEVLEWQRLGDQTQKPLQGSVLFLKYKARTWVEN